MTKEFAEVELAKLKLEIEDVKTAAALQEQTQLDDVALVKQKYENEIASLHRILKEAVSEAMHNGEHERTELRRANQLLMMQLHDLRHRLSIPNGAHSNEDSIFSAVLRSLRNTPLTSPSGSTHNFSDLTESFNRAASQFDGNAEKLKFILAPYEEEISRLRQDLTQLHQKLNQFRKTDFLNDDSVDDGLENGDSKIKQSTKGDLEIYVAVLNTQKRVLQEDINAMKERLVSLNGLLRRAQLEAAELQLATVSASAANNVTGCNDNILQQCSSNDVDGEKSDNFNVRQQKLDGILRVFAHAVQLSSLPTEENDNSLPIRSITTAQHDALNDGERKRSLSLNCFNSITMNTAGIVDNVSQLRVSDLLPDTRKSVSLNQLNVESELPLISVDSTVDCKQGSSEELIRRLGYGDNDSTSADSRQEEYDTGALESDSVTYDSNLLHNESLADGSNACEMCANYEQKLQQAQDSERKINDDLKTLKSLADRYQKEFELEQQTRSEIEAKASGAAEQFTEKMRDMIMKMCTCETALTELKCENERSLQQLKREMTVLMEQKHLSDGQLEKLQDLYDKLLGRHRLQAAELRAAEIELPATYEELQHFALKLREELIETRAANEHLEESSKSELLFLRDQMRSEHTSREQLEESLTEEINQLRTELGMSRSEVSKLQEDARKVNELEQHSVTSERERADLRRRLEESERTRKKFEADMHEQKKRIQALQVDLDNSEAVQRDFVRLSQSLQIELEKIRQAEHEVRWQHEEDALICMQCKKPFAAGKATGRKKLHCRHCGKIFCQECLTRLVPSGPQKRPSSVCDVCHTILEQNTAPYFASSPPKIEQL